VAYKLELPYRAVVHPVFHVSQLKLSPGGTSVSSTLPSNLTMFQILERILQRRWTSGSHPVDQVFVKWSHMPVSLATWESADHLRELFPQAPAWGHADSQEGGNVSPAATQDPNQQDGSQAGSTSPGERWPRKPNNRFFGLEWSNS
jgi:hypothetical protein